MKIHRIVSVVVGLLAAISAYGADAPSPGGTDFFEKKIRPVLAAECFRCHSASAQKLKGGLLLDTRDGMLKGGDTGPAVVPGNASASLLIKAVSGVDKDLQMPPKKKLGPDVLADFTAWIQQGAAWPKDAGGKLASTPAAQYDRLRQELWSWQPLKDVPAPAVKNAAWPKGDIDRFVLATLEANNWERWGRHWLDVARYAESSGMARNVVYHYAWRYRDYVIDAFNADKPYNVFLTEQLAGDLLAARDSADRDRLTVATGYLCVGPRDFNERNPRQLEVNTVDEQIDTLGKSILATTIACARCHDHKFDPIPTAEYYALAGVFMSSEEHNGVPRGFRLFDFYDESRMAKLAGYTPPPSAAAKVDYTNIEAAKTIGRESYFKLISSYRNAGYDFSKPANPIRPVAMAVMDNRRPTDARVLQRGEIDKPGEAVRRGFLSIPCIKDPPKIGSSESGRLELARWITRPDNPLTARVMVNRIWQHLLGVGIVASVDNFGTSGEKPTHPELLDRLAMRFMEGGWSVKAAIKEVMTSATYQQAATTDRAKFEVDPDNHYLWRQNQRRLEAEAIRDAMLAASGRINLTPPTGSMAVDLPPIPLGLGQNQFKAADLVGATTHRSVYLPIFRGEAPAALEVFDMTDANGVEGARDVTTVAPQALFMMNDPFVTGVARAMVGRLASAELGSDTARVDLAYKLALGRSANATERSRALTYVESAVRDAQGRGQDPKAAGLTAWSGLCQALFACAEFRYLN